MHEVRTGDRDDFPLHGARARLWGRFERDLRAWLGTPEGRFAQWRAQAAVAPSRPAPRRGGATS